MFSFRHKTASNYLNYNITHIPVRVMNMKTTIELSDGLFEQAKAAARAQGMSLKALIEMGLRMAIHPKASAAAAPEWQDLTFHPKPAKAGHLIEPSQWREAANPSGMDSVQ
jgi:hypothetical protein